MRRMKFLTYAHVRGGIVSDTIQAPDEAAAIHQIKLRHPHVYKVEVVKCSD